MILKNALPRRTFLRGIGATLSLPFLDAMVPVLSAQSSSAATPPRRLGIFYIPMGMNAAAWMPPEVGRITELSSTLAPLAPHLDKVTIVSNLELRNAYTTGNHASSNCAFLSCVRAKRTEGSDYFLGPTIDQIAAQQVGQETTFPSLELGADLIAQVGNCDNGYALRLSEQSVLGVGNQSAAGRIRPENIVRTSLRGRRHARRPAPPNFARAAASSTGCARTWRAWNVSWAPTTATGWRNIPIRSARSNAGFSLPRNRRPTPRSPNWSGRQAYPRFGKITSN